MFHRKLLRPDSRSCTDVKDVARVGFFVASKRCEGEVSLKEQQPHLVLEVEPVLLLAIVGEEILVFAVGIEGAAVFFD